MLTTAVSVGRIVSRQKRSRNRYKFAGFVCRVVQDFTDIGFIDRCERQEWLIVIKGLARV